MGGYSMKNNVSNNGNSEVFCSEFQSYLKKRSEWDLFTDTCVARATWKVVEYTGDVCDVYPYSDSYKPLKQVPAVESVTACNPPTGETFIPVLVQA